VREGIQRGRVQIYNPRPLGGEGGPQGRVRGSQHEPHMTNSSARRTSRSTARGTAVIMRAQELRRAATEAEQTAWRLVDFCCPQKCLVPELDGSVHAQPNQAVRDVRRDQYLTRLGTRYSASLTASR